MTKPSQAVKRLLSLAGAGKLTKAELSPSAGFNSGPWARICFSRKEREHRWLYITLRHLVYVAVAQVALQLSVLFVLNRKEARAEVKQAASLAATAQHGDAGKCDRSVKSSIKQGTSEHCLETHPLPLFPGA